MNFLELYVEVIAFGQCVTYGNCCVYLECSTLRIYSVYLQSNHPTATNSFVQGSMLMYLFITYTANLFNGSERRYIPQRFLTVEQFGNLLLTQEPFILVDEDSFQTRTNDPTNQVEARD